MTTPQLLSGRYELGEILGFGGMSEVHLARDVRLDRDVAVKVLRADLARDPSFQLRFRREAQNAAALNHPAIAAVHDTGEADTTAGTLPYIVMEYVDGVTLRELIHDDEPVDPQRAIEIIADACQALNFSHQHGIIHRDVKPANIMVTKAGAVKVMDFGISRALHDSGTPVTQAGAVVGTAQYLSPEQASGKPVDARSDVYALGCVLYELLTGEPPFVGDSPVAVAYQHVRSAPSAPSKRNPAISPELDAVVLKALAKDPADRYQSAADMRSDLIRVHSGQRPEAPQGAAAERASRPVASHSRSKRTNPATAAQPVLATTDRARPVRRWLPVIAVFAVLAIVASIAIAVYDSRSHPVPDVQGQAKDAAINTLQGLGFKVVTQPVFDSTVPVDHVVGTEPGAGQSLSEGDQVTVDVSKGPKEVQIPDVTTMTPDDAEKRLRAAGFTNINRTTGPSEPEQKGTVTTTVPAANATAATDASITLVVGMGPDTGQVPDCTTLTFEQCDALLKQSGFQQTFRVDKDGLLPAGQVIGTNPAASQQASVSTVIQILVSLGNQVPMPDLKGLTYDEIMQKLQGLGITILPQKGSDVPGGEHFKAVTQDPPAGTPINKSTGVITVQYGA
ncbi:Stk1 family PASTA domain-containing Ser/Thr kinase [Mycolicibacterium sp. 050158]|uniref:Stk1 family PASTA domain-containing Ser/Thr kinase n=1 Tax=Mycolicibacterium sp. 050158 TaxID=3090602 RepID=UPI00299DEBBD|nr:Stk1 family PASTA domain-containing Ser/Thr kinase [Mycolicibacterium sp. 050158]MDX1893342.1 Stk1 family PASTA domain-containing Ser/Thr kinase [Mycolicibacterium sp. 050158]